MISEIQQQIEKLQKALDQEASELQEKLREEFIKQVVGFSNRKQYAYDFYCDQTLSASLVLQSKLDKTINCRCLISIPDGNFSWSHNFSNAASDDIFHTMQLVSLIEKSLYEIIRCS